MSRRVVLGVSALALTVSWLAVTALPAAAKKPVPTATSIVCDPVTGVSHVPVGSAGLPINGTVVKKATLSGTITATGCTVTGGANGAETITNITLTTVTKLSKISIADLSPQPPADVPSFAKLTLSYRNAGGTVLCTSKAKAGTERTDATTMSARVRTDFPGAKAITGRCFKGKHVRMVHAGGGPIFNGPATHIIGLTFDETNGLDPELRSSLTIS